jgi:hypothetical protein
MKNFRAPCNLPRCSMLMLKKLMVAFGFLITITRTIQSSSKIQTSSEIQGLLFPKQLQMSFCAVQQNVFSATTQRRRLLKYTEDRDRNMQTLMIQIQDLNDNWRDVATIDNLGDQYVNGELRQFQEQYQGARVRAVSTDGQLINIL